MDLLVKKTNNTHTLKQTTTFYSWNLLLITQLRHTVMHRQPQLKAFQDMFLILVQNYALTWVKLLKSEMTEKQVGVQGLPTPWSGAGGAAGK